MIGQKFPFTVTPPAKFDETLPRRPGLIESTGTIEGKWTDDATLAEIAPYLSPTTVHFWETMFVCSPRGKAYRKVGEFKNAIVRITPSASRKGECD